MERDETCRSEWRYRETKTDGSPKSKFEVHAGRELTPFHQYGVSSRLEIDSIPVSGDPPIFV